MPQGAVIGTALTTHAAKLFSLFIDGVDVVAAVPIESIRITEGGYNASGSMEFDFDDPAKAYTFPTAAEVIFYDWVQDIPLFAGFLTQRMLRPAFGQQGRSVEMQATDYAPLLDQKQVPVWSVSAGASDRDIIQSLVGHFGGPISALSGTVTQTAASMPAMSFIGVTLRQAIEQVAQTAGSGRVYWLNSRKQLYYTNSSGLTAPYVMTDAPSGAQRAPANLTLDYEDTVVHGVYVNGGNIDGSGWVWGVVPPPSPGYAFTEYVNYPDSDTQAKRNFYGAGYLSNVNSSRLRGSFEIIGTKGWQPGQVVTITNSALGLSSATFLIVSVESKVLSGSLVQHHRIRFGNLPRSLARLLVQG